MGRAGASGASLSINLAWGGKLPSCGDFILSQDRSELQGSLDRCLYDAMEKFRLRMDGEWESRFNAAPIWNFILPPEVLGASCALGTISPSCDAIGRRFPFAVTYGLEPKAPPSYLSSIMSSVPDLLSQTGALLYKGIRQKWSRDDLEHTLERIFAQWVNGHDPINAWRWREQKNDSLILSVLNEPSEQDGSNGMGLLPWSAQDSFRTLPWSNVDKRIADGSATSFWWTNGAGGAPLKAFTYGPYVDGTLLTWLFG